MYVSGFGASESLSVLELINYEYMPKRHESRILNKRQIFGG